MSETPAPYGDSSPVLSSIITRVEELEQQFVAIATAQAQHTSTIAALVDIMDRFRFSVDSRLEAINQQLAAIKQSNQVMIDLITTRLPPPGNE